MDNYSLNGKKRMKSIKNEQKKHKKVKDYPQTFVLFHKRGKLSTKAFDYTLKNKCIQAFLFYKNRKQK